MDFVIIKQQSDLILLEKYSSYLFCIWFILLIDLLRLLYFETHKLR